MVLRQIQKSKLCLYFEDKAKCQWYASFYFTVVTPSLYASMNSAESHNTVSHNGSTIFKRNSLVASTYILFCLNDFWQPMTAFSRIEFNE